MYIVRKFPPYPTEYESEKDWKRQGIFLFGYDRMKWKFICPSCGLRISVQDWKDVGADEKEIAYSCIGRHIEDSHDAFDLKKKPCNYAGGGLLRINPVHIKGRENNIFQFAPPEI